MGKKAEMVGRRFGMWTVLEEDSERGKSRSVRYLCQCECGNKKVVAGNNLRSGKTISCGCNRINRITKHGEAKTKSRLYRIWGAMHERCLNPNNDHFNAYGGRGIGICNEWIHDFTAFRNWALSNGYNDDLSIDRIDVNGNYCPENCRWATAKEQSRNQRTSRIIEFNGECKCAAEWAEVLGISKDAVRYRADHGITLG